MDDILRVSASEFEKDAGRYQEIAKTRPVVVTCDDRDETVIISAEEYDRLKRRDRRAYAAGELPREIVEAIATTQMDPRHAHLDELIKDWTP